MKNRIISVLLMLSLFLSMATPTFAANASSDKNSDKHSDGIGRVKVSTIPLPDYVILHDATYTYSGKVFISYSTANDLTTTNFFNFATLNDDGSDFKVIFSGVIPLKEKTGGIRYMPFQDNKRILLGDYVFECMPNLDKCKSTNVVPIVYPVGLDDNNPAITTRWSEIIIAPDNKHMAWSMFTTNNGGGQAVGVLSRKTDSYVLEKVQLISTTEPFTNDPSNPGYIIPPTSGRGGEVKQFIHGGSAISVVGAKDNVTTDSVVEDLTSNKITQITRTPGYDETTIFSPDEQLGMVMSTRFSMHTDPAIFGIMPRPIFVGGGINAMLYYYSVAGVRTFRSGDIGPALIDINRSMNEPGYQGIQLSTDPNWVYHSPMSWHPDGKRAMWIEGFRGFDDDLHKRLQKVNLLDYKPRKTVPIKETSDDIAYATKDLTKLSSNTSPDVHGKIAGKKSGYIDYISTTTPYYSGKSEALYVNYSNDGVNFYNGSEKLNYNYLGETTYETNLQLTGANPGEMNLRATFSSMIGASPLKLLFGTAADGKPQSYGYATYNGVTRHMEDLIE
ncbi:hypothetical protein [Paenibacillus sp. P36]|uniref:hypothetical protein n=1 Tax=Paenibacillus sp. P36 TaxID=3342538 RepID=UPI0038B289A8